ncbi:hypothetical protein DB346_00805 [Verrucomicrobia bacterium LW23]|nr:hypothetical protein DB346_00805 [Verrucomicrobia bacterium LW23]
MLSGGGGHGGADVGTLLALLASGAFVTYVGYRIRIKRAEIRSTIVILGTRKDQELVANLSQWVESGRIKQYVPTDDTEGLAEAAAADHEHAHSGGH